MTLLTLIVLAPLIGALVAGLAVRTGPASARWAALAATGADLLLAFILMFFVRESPVATSMPWIPAIGAAFHLEADGLSAVLVLLTTMLGVVAVLISWNEITRKVHAYHVWLLLLQVGILLVFLARDIVLFYFGWELMLIPMFFLIGVWGHEDKLYSAIKFFLFTFTGSIFMLVALLYVYFQHARQYGMYSFEIANLLKTSLTETEQWWVFLGLFIGFAVKVPLFPLHTWLPDAHTQAPTAGSLILAGLLLKTGVYGLMRIAMPLAPAGAAAFAPMVITLAVAGIFYGALVAFSQRDFKRLVAYSSISHLGFVVLGLFIGNAAGWQGATLQMVNHGLATGGLFLIAGILQQRAHTRNFDMYGGLWRHAPTMGAFLLFFAMASLGIPGTGNFIGELYVIGGAFQFKWWLGVITAFGILFAAAYSLRVFIATMHGPESPTIKHMNDTTWVENLAMGILVAGLIVVGFVPRVVTAPLFYPPDTMVPRDGREPATIAAIRPGQIVIPSLPLISAEPPPASFSTPEVRK
ncbi:MAG: NADH-quinone oxidoreductase subunit M [bacterium]